LRAPQAAQTQSFQPTGKKSRAGPGTAVNPPPAVSRQRTDTAARHGILSELRETIQSPEIKVLAARFSTSAAGQFFIDCFALPAALRILSPANGIFGGESKYLPAQSICKLRNKFRSCGINLLARSGVFLLQPEKNRWKYRTSTGFSPLPAAGAKFWLKTALFCGFLGVVAGISALSLEIRIVSRKFKSIAGNPPKSRHFSARAGSFRSSAEVLNFQLEIRKRG
jgi:hypothetical protein